MLALFEAVSTAIVNARLDLGSMMPAVAQALVDRIGDGAILTLVDDEPTTVRVVAVAHRDPARRGPLAALVGGALPPDNVVLRVVADARPLRAPMQDDAIPASTFGPARAYADAHGVASYCVVPVQDGARVVGTIGVFKDGGGAPYTDVEQQVLVDVAKLVGVGLTSARAHADVERAERSQRMLVRAARRFAAAGLAQEDALRELAAELVDRYDAFIAVRLVSDDGALLLPAITRHPDGAAEAALRAVEREVPLRVGDGFMGRVAASGAGIVVPRRVPDLHEQAPDGYGEWSARHPVEGFMAAPLRVGERVLGVVLVARVAPDPVDLGASDLDALQALCDLVAPCLDNARRYAQAEADVRLRELVLGVVGHDLRNPIHAILLTVEAATATTAPDDPTRLRLLRIRAAADRAARVIADVVAVGRAMAPSSSLTRADVDVAALCADLVEEARVGAPGRGFTCDAPGPVIWSVDRARFEQVVANLLSNAVVHGSADGPVALRVAVEGDALVVAVKNPGAPISDATRATMFEPFKTAGGAGASGLGLGLFICRRVVDAHGGTITCASVDDGTEFVVRLPPRAEPRGGTS